MVGISIDKAQLSEVENLLGSGRRSLGAKALQAAVSETVRNGITDISKRLREEVNLRKADVDAVIKGKRGSYSDPVGEITITHNAVWLAQYLSGKQRGYIAKAGSDLRSVRGVHARKTELITVKVRKRSSGKYPATQTFPRGFLAVMPRTAYLGIFERTGVKRVMKKGRHQGKVREEIHRMRGPTPLGVFLNARGEEGAQTVIDEVTATLTTKLHKNVLSQIDRFLAERQQKFSEATGG